MLFVLSFLLHFIIGAAELPEISYLDALDAVLSRSPEVAAQDTKIDGVWGQTLPDRLSLLPSISLQARQDTRREFGLDATRTGAAASLDFNLFRFGSDISGMRAASREVEAERLQLEAARIEIESSAIDALNQYLQTAKEVAILTRLVGLRENLYRLGKKRFDRGLIPSQEVDKLSIDWENEKALLRDADTAVIRSSARVDELLGHHRVQTEWPWIERLSQKRFPLPEKDENVLAQRPDWKTAQKRFSANEARAAQSWGKIFPSLDFNVSYGYYSAAVGGVNSQRPEWASSLVLTVPLFDRLSNYGAYEALSQAAKAAEFEWERVKRSAKKEWDSAKGAMGLSVETALTRDKTLAVSRSLYQDGLKRFERGLIEANDLNVDQQRLLQSELLAVRGWATAHTTLARLCFAQGLRIRACFEKEKQ